MGLPHRLRFVVFQIAMCLLFFLAFPSLATAALAFLLWPLIRESTNTLGCWLLWGAVTPLVYTGWLILFLLICVGEVHAAKWYRCLRKQPRVTTHDGVFTFYGRSCCTRGPG